MRKRYSSSVRIFYSRSSKEDVIRRVGERLDELKAGLPVSLVVLFGSYAKGRHSPSSDIDLLVVYEGKKRNDDYAAARKILDIRGLELHIYCGHEYALMKETIGRMTRGGITIFQS